MLRLELLRARAAAERIELSAAAHEIYEGLHPLRRVADALGSAARAFSGRGHLLGWLATTGAALTRGKWLKRALASAAIGLVAKYAPSARSIAVGALLATLLARRARRTRRPDAQGASTSRPESAT
jgi:hypothetical protein